jgi:hypothetical protein
VGPRAIELHADPARRLRRDRTGRDMVISCGAALFGLRLAVRELGFLPAVTPLPDRAQPDLIARVALGPRVPVTGAEHRMLEALPHRHTHRGPFEARSLPAGLLAGLQHDAFAEGATLALIGPAAGYPKLAALVAEATRTQALNPAAREEILRWSRVAGSTARDGVPAAAFPQVTSDIPGRLAPRDFDLGRHLGQLPAPGGGEPAPATMVLVTQGDTRADWLAAGQALHRVLAHAATAWVSASLHSQPLELPVIRDMIRARLALPGPPQMLLQLGVTRSSLATPRRPVPDLLA